MAYRFLLEVPETLVGDANIVVNHVPDAQVILARDSHGLGYEDPYKDLSVAAHSLRVLDAIYAWYDDMGATSPSSRTTLRIVLHGGERLSVGEVPKDQMVAAIRRDQPWVERTIPKIGEHETRHSPGTSVIETSTVPDVVDEAGASVGTLARQEVGEWVRPVTILASDDPNAHTSLMVAGVPQIVLDVVDPAKPERVYGELFGLQMVGRGNRTDTGGWEFLDPAYDTEQNAQWGLTPQYAFLQNGPLSIALRRVGRSLPLNHYRDVPAPIRVAVDRASLARVKATVLMRSYNVFENGRDHIVFRDPFGYTWAVSGYDEGTVN
jgi:hypothetical protein